MVILNVLGKSLLIIEAMLFYMLIEVYSPSLQANLLIVQAVLALIDSGQNKFLDCLRDFP
jgi:hypothetical protein